MVLHRVSPQSAAGRAPAPGTASVEDPSSPVSVVGRSSVPVSPTAHSVTALLLIRDAATAVDLLDAVAASRRRPDRIVVVDLCGGAAAAAASAHHRCRPLLREEDVLRPPAGAELDTVMAQVEKHLVGAPEDWWWVLVDDTVPTPDTLAGLLDALHRGQDLVAAVGPVLVEADRPERLVQAGYQLTRWGRAVPDPAPGALDQGQYRDRADVLGVPIAGSLLRVRAWRAIGGLDPALSGDDLAVATSGLDLGWRLHRSGRRVLVAGGTVLPVGETMAAELAPDAAWRARVRRIALARTPLVRAIPTALAVLLLAPVLALLTLTLGRGRRAAGSVLSEAAGAARLGIDARARWRWRRRAGRVHVPHRHLRALFTPAFTELIAPPAHAAWARNVTAGVRESGNAESGPVSAESQSMAAPRGLARRVLGPGLLAVLAVLGATLLAVRDWFGAGLLGGSGSTVLTSPHVRAEVTDAAGLWSTWADSWHGSGLGDAGVREPWWALLALPTQVVQWIAGALPVGAPTSPASLTLAWLLALTPAAATLAAYVAARAVVASRWPRAGVALLWGTQPLVWGAVSEARPGAAALLVLAPLALGGIVSLARRGRPALLAATIGVLTLLAALAPAVALALTLLALVLAVARPGLAWLRFLLLAALPWVLLGPWTAVLARDPRLLFSGPGLTTTSADPVWQLPAWQRALGGLSPEVGAGDLPALLVMVAAPAVLVLLAAVGVARRGRPGRTAAFLVAGAILLLAASLSAPPLGLGPAPAGDAVLVPWPGTFLITAYALLIPAACLGLAAAPARTRGAAGSRVRLAALVAGAVAPAIGLAGSVLTVLHDDEAGVAAAEPAVPAVARELATSGFATRTLVLTSPTGEGAAVGFDLRGAEPGRWLRDPVVETGPWTGGEARALAPVTPAVTALLDSTSGGDPQAGHLGVLGLGVGHVALDTRASGVGDGNGADAAVTEDLITRLDRTSGLRRITDATGTADGVAVWRVLPAAGEAGAPTDDGTGVPPARVTLVDPAGVPVATVPTVGPHARTVDGGFPLPAPAEGVDPSGVRLRVSEGAPGALPLQVSVGGQRLEPLPMTDLPAADLAGRAVLTYDLPDGWGAGDPLVIDQGSDADPWRLVPGIGLALLALGALPLARARRGETS